MPTPRPTPRQLMHMGTVTGVDTALADVGLPTYSEIAAALRALAELVVDVDVPADTWLTNDLPLTTGQVLTARRLLAQLPR